MGVLPIFLHSPKPLCSTLLLLFQHSITTFIMYLFPFLLSSLPLSLSLTFPFDFPFSFQTATNHYMLTFLFCPPLLPCNMLHAPLPHSNKFIHPSNCSTRISLLTTNNILILSYRQPSPASTPPPPLRQPANIDEYQVILLFQSTNCLCTLLLLNFRTCTKTALISSYTHSGSSSPHRHSLRYFPHLLSLYLSLVCCQSIYSFLHVFCWAALFFPRFLLTSPTLSAHLPEQWVQNQQIHYTNCSHTKFMQHNTSSDLSHILLFL